MAEDIKLADLIKMLNMYESGLKEEAKYNRYSETVYGKLEAVKNIRHRILVLSCGGFKIVKK
jgi:hypothetical protein